MPPKSATAKPSRLKSFFTVIIALAALLLSGGAAVLAWRANSTASDTAARVDALSAPKAAPAEATASPAQPVPTAESSATTDQPTEPGNSAPPTLNAQTQYTVRYSGKSLRIPPTSCSDPIYVDFDQPAVQTDPSIAEVSFGLPCGSGSPFFHLQPGMKGSAATETVTPTDCAVLGDASPLLADGNHPIRPSNVYCVVTSDVEAKKAGITWKMVVMTVTGVAQDNTIALRVSAWDIPG